MTPAERKAAERRRKESIGLVRVEVWVPRSKVAEVKNLAWENSKGRKLESD